MIEETKLHKRNKHSGKYDFTKLISAYPALEKYVALNKYGTLTIDFFDPEAVKALNKALLILYYNIEYWDIPTQSLCPPIPGRADYIHRVSDLVGSNKKDVRCLDIGVGANCIYPIIGCCEYGWEFVGSDIDLGSLENAQKIIDNNEVLKGKIELCFQNNRNLIFKGIIVEDDFFDIVICNPPFYGSQKNAEKESLRKFRNLKRTSGKSKIKEAVLNFGGSDSELWCEGGEVQFISNMIIESNLYSKNCNWFTSLVSREENLMPLIDELYQVKIIEYKVIEMQQGNKKNRILAWRY